MPRLAAPTVASVKQTNGGMARIVCKSAFLRVPLTLYQSHRTQIDRSIDRSICHTSMRTYCRSHSLSPTSLNETDEDIKRTKGNKG